MTEYEFEEVTLTLAPVDGVVEGVPVDVLVRLFVEELDGLTPVLSEIVGVTLIVAVRLCVADALAAVAAPLTEAVAEALAPLLPVTEGETLTECVLVLETEPVAPFEKVGVELAVLLCECVEDEDSEAEAPVLNVGVVLGVIVDE